MGVLIKIDQDVIRAGGCPSEMGDFLDGFSGGTVEAELIPHPAAESVDVSTANGPQVTTRCLATGGVGQVPSTATSSGFKVMLSFTLGNNAVEVAGALHCLTITARNASSASNEYTFRAHYLLPRLPGTTTGAPATTTSSPTTTTGMPTTTTGGILTTTTGVPTTTTGGIPTTTGMPTTTTGGIIVTTTRVMASKMRKTSKPAAGKPAAGKYAAKTSKKKK